jgi:hypothetical protein
MRGNRVVSGQKSETRAVAAVGFGAPSGLTSVICLFYFSLFARCPFGRCGCPSASTKAFSVPRRSCGRVIIELLAVATMLKSVSPADELVLVILGKQAIDDDCNQTDQMLTTLTG